MKKLNFKYRKKNHIREELEEILYVILIVSYIFIYYEIIQSRHLTFDIIKLIFV